MMMQALCADAVGEWRNVLQWKDEELGLLTTDAALREHEVLIRVAFCDLNPVDLQKTGQKRAAATRFTPGFSGSGVVVRVGSNISNSNSNSIILSAGARVAFLTSAGGAYAEYVVVDARAVAVIPPGICLAHASVVPLAGCTAYEALGKLGLGRRPSSDCCVLATATTTARKRLLIVGGAGGVGSYATALAKAWWGDALEIICTASTTTTTTSHSGPSVEWCLQQGADQVIGHDELLLQLGGGPQGSVDAILCLTEPTSTLMKGMSEVIRPYGTLCLVVAGPSIQSLDAGFFFFKCANIVTETVFTSFRTNFAHCSPAAEISEILELMAQGKLKAPLATNNPRNGQDWKQALDSGGVLEALASGHTQGKLYMRIHSDLE